MLVSTRKIGDKVYFNHGDVVMNILDCEGGKVKFGIQAPASLRIHHESPQQLKAAEEQSDYGEKK